MAKQFGLIIPGKDKSKLATSIVQGNIFGSDSEDEDNQSKPKIDISGPSTLKRQVRIAQQKALEEDPTVYQYDEIFDEMESKKVSEKKMEGKMKREPRYIGKLLETASKRKLEQERRVERQVQKEREAEGQEFADKETFVTTSYRKKLEELKKLEDEEKREDYLEAIGDVTKQQDLGGFYRHLYSQKMGDESISNKTANSENSTDCIENNTDKLGNAQNKKRHYRKRSLNPEKEDATAEEFNQVNKQHLQSNLDADSDFSIDSSDTEAENEDNKKITTNPNEESTVDDQVQIKQEKQDDNVKPQIPQWNEGFKIPEKIKKDEENKEVTKIKKPKIDIWKKRTVGDLFIAAQLRYYNRKSLRQFAY